MNPRRERFRRTNDEIKRGLTLKQARKERGKKKFRRTIKATLEEKVGLIKTIESELGIDISAPSEATLLIGKRHYAKPEEVVARIRKMAAAEVAKDPLCCSRELRTLAVR